jgi:4-azaleucine resistance transporter AzlC
MQQKRTIQFLSSVWKGASQAFPVILGVIPTGMAYGILAQQTGLSFWVTIGMSLFVFAGASQFMAVSMMHNAIEPGVIIGATFMVNFRHVLMSASIAPYLKYWKPWQRVLFGGMLTDETFLLHSLNSNSGVLDFISAVALNSSLYISWTASNIVGYNLGAMIANPQVWGLDFALPALFVGLLMSACKNKMGAVAAIVGGVISLWLHLVHAGNWAVFFGALAGATTGVCFSIKEGDEE